MGKIDTKILIKAINNSKDIETARRNLTSNNSDKTDYTTAATNITVVFADTLKSLKNILPVALYVNLVASYDKMTNDLNDDKSMKASNIVSFLGDITSMLTNSPFIPFNIKLTLYALSTSLTAISWGISELEEYSEANEKEKARLEALFKEYQEKLDKTWNTEAWNDPLCLLYEVKSASAAENSGNLSFKIIFNKELDSDLTMSYYTLDDTAKQNKDYNGANDKKAILFTIPKGVNEYDLKVPIIDDNEKENDEEFMLVVDDSKANYAGKYILLGQPSAKGTIIDDENSQNADFSNSDKNDKFTNLQNLQNGNFSNSQTSRHSESLIRHSELSQESEESHKNLQNICHSESLARHSERSEESHKNSQTSQNSQNTPKWELSFTEKLLLKDFAHKLYGVKMPETKQRIGADAATQHKIHSF